MIFLKRYEVKKLILLLILPAIRSSLDEAPSLQVCNPYRVHIEPSKEPKFPLSKTKPELSAHRIRVRGEGAHFREEPLEHEVAAVHRPGQRRRLAPPQRGLHHAAGAQRLTAAYGEHEHRGRVRQSEEQQGGPPAAPSQHADKPPRSRLGAGRIGAAHGRRRGRHWHILERSRGTMRGEADGGRRCEEEVVVVEA